MTKWFRFIHQVLAFLAMLIVYRGLSVAIMLPKWESQDYLLAAIAAVMVSGVFKGMHDYAILQGEAVGKDSNAKPAVSIP